MKLLTQIWDLGYRQWLIALAVGAALAASYVGYSFYTAQRDARAHKAFAEGLELYEAALAAEGSQESAQRKQIRWQEAEASFKLGYKQFSSSNLAPFFLGYQSETLLKLGQAQEAIALLDAMLSALGTSSPFYGPYAVKRALLKSDLNELKKLADDSTLSCQDLALYQLGEYYWAHNNPVLAQDAWKRLKEIGQNRTPPAPSPWAQLVAQRA